jgi:hypothetical protein
METTMSFQLVPDDAPPRLVRFVSASAMPSSDTVALLDRRTNVLLIVRELFDVMSPEVQASVIKTHHAALEFA